MSRFGTDVSYLMNAVTRTLTRAVNSCVMSLQEGLNILHCAAINNHTHIVDYIVNDLQIKNDLDKDDEVARADTCTNQRLYPPHSHMSLLTSSVRTRDVRNGGFTRLHSGVEDADGAKLQHGHHEEQQGV